MSDEIVPGVCRGCRQRSELVASGMCEDCLNKSDIQKADPNRPTAPQTPPIEGQPLARQAIPDIPPQPVQSDIREKLLDYIISKADDKFIDKTVKRYAKGLKEGYGWINLIQQTPDDKILLRIATELGYHKDDSEKEELKEMVMGARKELEDEVILSNKLCEQISVLKRELVNEREKHDPKQQPKPVGPATSTVQPRRPGRPPKASNDRNKPKESGQSSSVLPTQR